MVLLAKIPIKLLEDFPKQIPEGIAKISTVIISKEITGHILKEIPKKLIHGKISDGTLERILEYTPGWIPNGTTRDLPKQPCDFL